MAANLEQLTEMLISIRRNLHEHPELSYEEFETTKTIKNWLEEKNITIINSSLETGVIAEISGNNSGPIIAIRADIDALFLFKKKQIYRTLQKFPVKCMLVGMIFIQLLL